MQISDHKTHYLAKPTVVGRSRCRHGLWICEGARDASKGRREGSAGGGGVVRVAEEVV